MVGHGSFHTETVSGLHTYHQVGINVESTRKPGSALVEDNKGEGMEESGNEGLDDLVRREGGCFDGVECVCIVSQFLIPMIQIPLNPEEQWLNVLNTRTPVLTYGSRTTRSQFLDLFEISTQASLAGPFMSL